MSDQGPSPEEESSQFTANKPSHIQYTALLVGTPSGGDPKLLISPSTRGDSPKRKKKLHDPLMFWVNFAGFVAVVLYTSVAAWQACLLNQQIALDHPPTFRMANFVIYPHGGKKWQAVHLKPGTVIDGEAQFTELGIGPATIYYAPICMVYWQLGRNLPMERPYLSDAPDPKQWCGQAQMVEPHHGLAIKDKSVMHPGNFGEWKFTTTVPRTNATLYVLGFIKFKDQWSPVRYSLFARRYDPSRGRFVTVDSPDYEREDEKALDK
jgi:hypothetical protein